VEAEPTPETSDMWIRQLTMAKNIDIIGYVLKLQLLFCMYY